ncbi:MAG: hypothetical protein ACRDRT_19575, partial [Pseudonocardiaceae bacterium]
MSSDDERLSIHQSRIGLMGRAGLGQGRILGIGLVLGALVVPSSAPALAASPAVSGLVSNVVGGRPCFRLAVPAALPVGIGIDPNVGCSGVRPGAAVRTPLGICTLNFLWRGSDGANYVGTAGHCLLEGGEEAEVAFEPGTGPVVLEGRAQPDGSYRQIGRFAYAVSDQQSDFALIRLDPGVDADPAVCFFGGPIGVDDRPLPLLGALASFG